VAVGAGAPDVGAPQAHPRGVHRVPHTPRRPAPRSADVSTAATDPDAARVNELVDRLLAEFPPATTPVRRFLEAQFDLGLGWVDFPPGYGGLGVSAKLQALVTQRLYD